MNTTNLNKFLSTLKVGHNLLVTSEGKTRRGVVRYDSLGRKVIGIVDSGNRKARRSRNTP